MRIYNSVDDSGKEFDVPSVTTILSALGSVELMRWANSLGFRHKSYEKTLDEYADRGTKYHGWVEGIIRPREDSVKREDLSAFEQEEYDRVIANLNGILEKFIFETILCEETFVSKELGYGGTLDWLAEINSKHKLLIDFKSSKKVHIKHLLQLGGYHNLLVEKGIQIDGAAIILINDKIGAFYPINLTTVKYLGEVFNKLSEYYNMIEDFNMKPDDEFLAELLKS